MTVPPTTTRTTRCTRRVLTFAPRSPTLPVQLTFCPVSSLSSQPRACRSSTMHGFASEIGMSHAAERPVEVRSRCATTRARALAPPAPPESRIPTRDLATLFPDRARVPGDYHHRPHRKPVAAHRPLPAGARHAVVVRDEQAEQTARALRLASESQQLAHLGSPLTIDEITRDTLFRDGRARLYASRRS